ncbi:glycosyltransferase family 1 protein [Pseudocercospora fijiensis CIRAD86]|uniref:Glycosyltransferase family 1 protein n=1 Tax=Pseudocercospora fijiensis (strain CIRAD86) TaxID=383855 RepID=M3AZA4_PSEFD|nr:glycosyltransferase family 1 protein [Pseudocercospora fijiensis CIRAD86]EME82537.1 glycosyltransferase family 1 protein [Pseudocercospora fijiensis CIRAD86]
MATPDTSRRLDVPRSAGEPALLTDETGHSIVPTHPISGIDFGAHLSQGGSCIKEEAEENGGSYFSDLPGRASDVKPPKKSTTTPSRGPDNAILDGAALKRAQTAPPTRPKAPTRSSTLMRAMRRDRFACEYTFDPMYSDSDSSSSDDEAERRAPARPRRATRTVSAKDKDIAKQNAKEGRSYSRFKVCNDQLKTKGRVSKRDGRLNISINETANSGYLAKTLGQTIRHHLDIPNRKRGWKQRQHTSSDHPAGALSADLEKAPSPLHPANTWPRLNIVIMIIGSRGDIQPFIKVGKILRDEYGHRVRIATHPTFRDFVEKDSGLEFFSVGGDPSELMAFMVKNPGLIPSLSTIREGEIPRRRKAMGEMFDGMYRACTNSTDDEKDVLNLKLMGTKAPFIADAIIANPPSMAHVHIAERLGIPLHIMFTFPYSPTQAFPHPLANIKPGKSNVDANYVNFMSYPLVEMMTWQGLGDIVNKFRVKTLGLEPVSSLWAPGALYRMKVPYTYMWSPSLVPKPADWGDEIDISGFVFLEMANTFKPPEELQKFLDAGPPPVYIGFGSIVVDDPNKFTEMIFEATKIAEVRAVVNKGWGGLGRGNDDTLENIFMLENTPHDWLFPKVKAVVHHGGAGTTAIGLKCAKPTMIIPFFGDQPFWAARVVEAGAGAKEVIPWKRLTAENFAEGIKQCLTEEAQRNAQKLADNIAREGDGAANAVKSFHRALPLSGMNSIRCSVLEDRVAEWRIKGSALKLSTLAAEILQEKGKIRPHDLRLLHKVYWNDFDGPGEPLTGMAGAVTDSLYGIGAGMGMVPVRVAKHLKRRAEHERKKAAHQRRKEDRKQRKQEKAEVRCSEPQATKELERPTTNRGETSNTLGSTLSADPPQHVFRELVDDVREGIKQSGWAFLTMPNDLHMAIAQGFHNAPRLYGDATVRKPIRITGVKSGCRAARKEFWYGIYDAWTGLVTQPVGGFKDGDTLTSKLAGMGTGFGKGLGGFVLKNLSAVVSPPAYAGKGVMIYIRKKTTHDNLGSKHNIRRSHLVQGYRDYQALKAQSDPQGREQLRRIEEKVDEGWKVYEDIWSAAYEEYGVVGGGIIARFKLNKEKRAWQRAGVLENIRTAERTLQVRKEGQDIHKYLAEHRSKEKDLATTSRPPAMEEPKDGRVKVDDLPKTETSYASDEPQTGEEGKVVDDSERKPSQSARSESQSTTAVNSSEDEDKKRDSRWPARSPVKMKVVDHGDLLKAIARGGTKSKPALGRVTTT